jgi:hypothetical protein
MSEEVDRDRALGFAAALALGVMPEEIHPSLADGPTAAEQLLAARTIDGTVRTLQRSGVLDRPRTPLDLTPQELEALAAIHGQVRPWLLKDDRRPLSDVLKVMPLRVAENVAFLLNRAGWADLPSARFRPKEDECDER